MVKAAGRRWSFYFLTSVGSVFPGLEIVFLCGMWILVVLLVNVKVTQQLHQTDWYCRNAKERLDVFFNMGECGCLEISLSCCSLFNSLIDFLPNNTRIYLKVC